MDQRLHFLTLGVRDLARARRFYVDGLGWRPTLDVEGEVCFLQVAPGVLLALWRAEALAEDLGRPVDSRAGPDRVAMATNVGSPAEVDVAVARALEAGGTVLKAPQTTFFGYHAYVADPEGFAWEIAHNPGWRIDADGTAHLGDA